MIKMQDSIDANALTRGAGAYAGYVDGNPAWRSFSHIVSRFGAKAHCLSITVRGGEAECADIETGDMSPSQAGPWVRAMLRAGVWRPCVYANAATMPSVKTSLAGLPRGSYRLWVAAYPGGGATIPDGYDAHQYADHGPHGENIDLSVCRDDFFQTPPPKPKPARKPHPKVVGSSAGAALGAGISAILIAVGVHVTAPEASAISTIAAAITGYITPSKP